MIWKDKAPKWQRDFDEYLEIYNTFLVQGFVNDLHPLPSSYLQDDQGWSEIDLSVIPDWFSQTYSAEDRAKWGMSDGKAYCVIGYDPTKTAANRFDFFVADDVTQESEQAQNNAEQQAQPEKPVNPFVDTDADKAAFFDLIHDDKAAETLIAGHNAEGVSLDFARIHYAVSGGLKNKKPYMFVISASRISLSPGNVNSEDEQLTFSAMFTISNLLDTAKDSEHNENKLVIVANKINDIPAWVENEQYNHTIKKLYVSRPERTDREFYFANSFSCSSGCIPDVLDAYVKERVDPDGTLEKSAVEQKTAAVRKKMAEEFAGRTDGFSMRELEHFKAFADREDSGFTFDNLRLSVSRFKSGVTDNPWTSDEIVETVKSLKEKCGEVIKGQDRILEEAQRIMALAVTEVNRTFTPNAPRAVFFLAGPTGTGKTELAKQLTEKIFHNSDRMKRFDMSEFKQDHSDARLFGAPPGYVGFEAGGELTEYVKRHPFSLILFDEIEKACGSIMDKFLQILSDGRLTDGQGETVDFSNSIIIMTSNAGVKDPNAAMKRATGQTDSLMEEITNDSMDKAEKEFLASLGNNDEIDFINLRFEYSEDTNPKGVNYAKLDEEIKNKLVINLEKHFSEGLHRPELYGRIKESIVCYNFISADTARDIALQYIDRTNADIAKRSGATILMEKSVRKNKQDAIPFDPVKNKIARECTDAKVRAYGARSVIEHVKTAYAGTLSMFLLCNKVKGKTIKAELVKKGDKEEIVWRFAD